ncbi:MAG: response regulator [Chloroflexi bacterium]|nr:response regulator [Chloroflexota bacterium]
MDDNYRVSNCVTETHPNRTLIVLIGRDRTIFNQMRRFAFSPSFTIALAVNMALVIVVISTVMTVFDVRRERRAFADQVEVRGVSLSTAATDVFASPISSGDSQALADVVRDTRIRRELAYLVVISLDGQPLSKVPNSESYDAEDGFGKIAIHTETVIQRTQGSLIEFASPVMLDGKAIAGVQFGFSTAPLDSELSAIITQRIWQTSFLLLIGVISTVLISHLLMGPVRSLIAAVTRVSDGGEFVDETKRTSEFARLSSAVGEMVRRLQSSANAEPVQTPSESDNRVDRRPAAGSSRKVSDARQNGVTSPAPETERTAASTQPATQPAGVGLNAENQQFLADAQRRLEEALHQTKAAEDAAQLAMESAHTINNLVTPITAYSKIAQQKLPQGSPLISSMQEIEEAGNRIAALATKIQQYVPQVPLIEVIEPAADEFTARPHSDEIIENNVFLDKNSTVALVVDDESMVRRVTTSILAAEGYTILEASNGMEAVETAKRFVNVRIRLLVTDVLMPMMGAKDLAAIMGDIHPETLVVYTSGYTAESLIAHGALDPESTFIPKPLNREALLGKIQEAVDARNNEINEAAGLAAQID